MKFFYFIKDVSIEFLSIIQFIILAVSYLVSTILFRSADGVVIGVTEISKLLYLFGKVIPSATKVCLDENRFYNLDYDYKLRRGNRLIFLFKRLLFGPVLLAYLSRKNNLFIYLWSTGFLLNRKYDFIFLKFIDKKIANIFIGDDIRSPILLKNILKDLNYEGFLESYGIENPFYVSDQYDNKKKSLAKLTDDYAHVCFSYPVDQASYLLCKQYPVPYISLDQNFSHSELKFLDKKLKILHAPTSSIIKGTSFVREAIKQLKADGYDFIYKELINVQHDVVLKELESSHIVLNQFFAFVPGMFGIESMANHCAVMMSADPKIELNLPKSAKDAWMITRYSEIYDNLKYLLDNPREVKKYADQGYAFVKNNYSEENVYNYFKKIFKKNGIEI